MPVIRSSWPGLTRRSSNPCGAQSRRPVVTGCRFPAFAGAKPHIIRSLTERRPEFSIETDSFKEHGGALSALRGRSIDKDVGYSTVGLRAGTIWHWRETVVVPHVSAAWQHAFDDVTPEAALAFASTDIGFIVTGVPLAEDSALIDAGFDFALGPGMTLGASYSGQIASDLIDNAVKGRDAGPRVRRNPFCAMMVGRVGSRVPTGERGSRPIGGKHA